MFKIFFLFYLIIKNVIFLDIDPNLLFQAFFGGGGSPFMFQQGGGGGSQRSSRSNGGFPGGFSFNFG
jgi:hypothetical protein